MMRAIPCCAAALLVATTATVAAAQTPGPISSAANPYARDAKQPIDEAYTKKIKEYTTAPYFTSPLVDYLPASKTVPTPSAVLRRRRRRAGHPALLGRGLPVHAACSRRPARA